MLRYFGSVAELVEFIRDPRVTLRTDAQRASPSLRAQWPQPRNMKGLLSLQSPFFTAGDILSINDMHDEYDYKQLQAAHFSTNDLTFDAIAPKQFGEAADSAPVMVVQAKSLRGGLLLFLVIHHYVLDARRFFSAMKIWPSCWEEVAPVV